MTRTIPTGPMARTTLIQAPMTQITPTGPMTTPTALTTPHMAHRTMAHIVRQATATPTAPHRTPTAASPTEALTVHTPMVLGWRGD